MSNTLNPLPTELWELVIDLVGDSADACNIRPTYDALQSCALTTHAWIPRTTVNLYRFVCLSSASQLYAFIWTLRQQEWKGTLVRELHITPSDRSRYLPFCHGVLVSRLSRLETLVLRNVDLRGYYPPYYHQLIAQFRVNNLTLADCGVSLGQLLPLIRSMRTLRTLRLLCKSPHLVHAPNALVTTQSRDLPLAESLTLVELEDPFFAHSEFPYPRALGDLITDLSLTVHKTPGDNLLGFVASLSALSILRVRVRFEDTDAIMGPMSLQHLHLPSILSQLKESGTMHTFVVSIEDGQQYVTRRYMLDILCSNALKDVMRSLQSLKEYRIELNDTRPGDAVTIPPPSGNNWRHWWWTQNIESWSPAPPGVYLALTVNMVDYDVWQEEELVQPPPAPLYLSPHDSERLQSLHDEGVLTVNPPKRRGLRSWLKKWTLARKGRGQH